MEMWKWVEKLGDTLNEAGQGASAKMLDDFTNHVSDLEIERAEALLPEARALAKSLKNPWLEVFVGHWEMRYRLDGKLEGESALPDMVALFERAHRADAIDCPQSVCVTQDLADCYGNIDGAGWAAERRAVVEETLTRIDPGWNCFVCLTIEYADALHDEGRFEDGLAWLDKQLACLRETGRDEIEDSIEIARAEHLMGLGRAAEALDILNMLDADAKEHGAEWEKPRQERLVHHALALAMLGRGAEAWDMLPAWDDTVPGNRDHWIATAGLLLAADPTHNTWQLGSRFQDTLDLYSRQGAHRPLINCALIVARLALARGAAWSAQRILALARQHQPRLKADCGAAAKLDALEAEVNAMTNPPLPVPVAQLVDWLEKQENRNPEREVDWLLAAHRDLPDDQTLACLAASALRACGAHEDGENLLWSYLDRHPAEEPNDVAVALLNACLQRGRRERIDALAHHFDVVEPPFACWCRARWAAREQNWQDVIRLAETALALEPDRGGFLQLLAEGLRGQKRFAEAAAVCLRLANLADNPNPHPALWDHMSCACAAGDWEVVRASAARLEIRLDSDSGPIDEDWGWIIIRYEEKGETLDYYARRTGPVSARILENASPRQSQHVNDEVIFDASWLETPPEDEEERKNFIYTYALVHTAQSGGYGPSWLVEGVHPGEERLKSLINTLEDQGHQVWIFRENYELTDHDNDSDNDNDNAPGQPLSGVLFSVAAPQDCPALDLHKLLRDHTRDLPHGMCWLNLAEHCGAETASHEAIIERYGL
jgi:tetratricopeptide (TPR) repeat protein